MKTQMHKPLKQVFVADQPVNQQGFSLTEFLIAALILCIASAAIFSLLSDIQHAAGYQSEVQSVLNNVQIAMQTVERYIRQSGNDPMGSGITGITIVSDRELRVQSDLTGSAGMGNPDKGDPDGDIDDSAENVTIRLNDRTRSLEIVPAGGPAQIVAGYISAVRFYYYDAAGGETTRGEDVRRIGISISGGSLKPDPKTHQIFSVRLDGEILVSS